ncbi:MAG: hypothetical protein JSS49_14240 [Planctomycetes bacterium]|nr:hypothetical protein [Planctomycetota bacterium]
MRIQLAYPVLTMALLALTVTPLLAAAPDAFGVRVVDDETGRGVPLVELRSVHDIRYVTDSAGYAAIRDPELMGQTVFLTVRSHGYEFPKDGFGISGRAVKVTGGNEETLKIKRLNIAERMYRVTGAGIYADSVLLGHPAPIEHPLNNGQVAGSDSVVMTVYRDKIHWFWGDTNRLRYPLGNFNVTGATSQLPSHGGLDPAVGVNLNYFTADDGFARPMAKMPGEGPTWIFGIVVLKDPDGRERMFTGYEKVRPPLEIYERGICEFDDARQEFVKIHSFGKDVPLYLHGHPFVHAVGGVNYVYFGDPYPVMRVPATATALLDLSQYEAFTCLTPGGREKDARVERDAAGKVVWGWKRDTAAISFALQESLHKNRQLQPNEDWLQLTDTDSGKGIEAHRGSVTWNEFRKRWILITTQFRGSSMLGEVWYSEARQPEGPWMKAKKIVTHDKYSFYNPKQHPQFTSADGRFVFFEGTYTQSFSGNTDPTPRYEYNQMMYRLDLGNAKLKAAHAE